MVTKPLLFGKNAKGGGEQQEDLEIYAKGYAKWKRKKPGAEHKTAKRGEREGAQRRGAQERGARMAAPCARNTPPQAKQRLLVATRPSTLNTRTGANKAMYVSRIAPRIWTGAHYM